MWNGTAEILKASAAMMKTMPTTTPAETPASAEKASARRSKLVVPAKP
jgi:hypothetical protein